MAACSSPSSSRRASRRASSAAAASRLLAAVCAEDAFNSSEALPKEKARRRRDFLGPLGSFFNSARRFAAGDSIGGDEAVVAGALVDPAVGHPGEVDGCERGEGLLVRFSSGLPVLLVIELASGDCPSRTYQEITGQLNRFKKIGNKNSEAALPKMLTSVLSGRSPSYNGVSEPSEAVD